MKTPLAQLKKAELVYLATHRCPHRHLLIEHLSCRPKPVTRIGHLDIESSGLEADAGFILTWSILDDETDEVICDSITKADIDKATNGDEDKRVVASLIAALRTFDHVTGYYSSRFDVPFIRTRALVCGLDFPEIGALHHTDVYFWARYKLKLSRNSMENVCRTILGSTEKTHFDRIIWRKASRGDKKSIAMILDHNKRDVRDLKKVYHKLLPFVRGTKRSI
jgi:uncharacterized protein YprB with RNaseH-like and TPR domain